MSESANLRQNLQNVPSIFEISAAETLDSLIYPALSKIFDYLHLGVDFKLLGVYRLKGDVPPILTWVLQYLYLRNRSSSFGESFYGLQRTGITAELMTRKQKLISASILTLMPVLERKLKTRSTHHEDISIWERQLLNALRVYHASKAIHTFLYLIKYAGSHSPIFRALNLSLRYPTEPPKDDKTTYIFLKLLEVFAFFLQFIQWWYSDEQRRKIGGTLKNPEPFKNKPDMSSENVPPIGDCPVCLMKIQTPTACSISGYVYCWKCIISHLKERSTCPVTGHQITLDDLVRIYEA